MRVGRGREREKKARKRVREEIEKTKKGSEGTEQEKDRGMEDTSHCT